MASSEHYHQVLCWSHWVIKVFQNIRSVATFSTSSHEMGMELVCAHPTFINLVFYSLILCPILLASAYMLMVISCRHSLVSASALMSSVKSRSVRQNWSFHRIQRMGWCITLFIVKFMTIRKRNGDNMHPCQALVSMLKESETPPTVLMQQLEFRFGLGHHPIS